MYENKLIKCVKIGTEMKKRILVIEDDIAISDLLKFYFEDEGYEVHTCFTAVDFYQIKSFKPDLITLDILLPDANGLDILRDLQNSDITCKIPVLLISVKESDKEKGLELGAVGFIGKPLDENTLKNTVNNILKNKLEIE